MIRDSRGLWRFIPRPARRNTGRKRRRWASFLSLLYGSTRLQLFKKAITVESYIRPEISPPK